MTILGGYSILQAVAFVGYELLLFAGAFFLIGAFDDILVDIHYLWGRLRGRLRTARIRRA